MPNTCSVSGCKTNYKGHPKATVFRLPKGPPELVHDWIRALHRTETEDLQMDNIFICIHHFREEDLIRVDRVLQADGTYSEVPRERPTYRLNSVPVIFQGCPSYFTSTSATCKRYSRESKEEAHFAKSLKYSLIEEKHEKFLYSLDSFEDLRQKLSTLKLKQDWVIWYSSNTLHILRLQSSDQFVRVESTLAIHSDLTVSANSFEQQVPLPLDKINDLRQIETLIDYIINFQPDSDIFQSDSVLVNIKEASQKLSSAVSILQDADQMNENSMKSLNIPHLPCLQFIICQLENSLVPIKQRRYNIVTQVSIFSKHFNFDIIYSN